MNEEIWKFALCMQFTGRILGAVEWRMRFQLFQTVHPFVLISISEGLHGTCQPSTYYHCICDLYSIFISLKHFCSHCFPPAQIGWLESAWGLDHCWKTEESSFDCRQCQEIFLPFIALGTALRVKQTSVQLVGCLLCAVRLRRESDHALPSRAEFKNEWTCNSTSTWRPE